LRISTYQLNNLRQKINWSGTEAKSKGFNSAVLFFFTHHLKKKYHLKKMRNLIGVDIEKGEYNIMEMMNKAQDKAKTTRSHRISAILHRNEENDLTKKIVVGMLQSLDCDCSYNDWKRVVFLILNTGWGCAYEIAQTWSAQSSNFNQKSFDRLVNSFESSKCSLHIKQLEHMWRESRSVQNSEDCKLALSSDEFYKTREWLELRTHVLDRYGPECMQCGRSKKIHNVVIHVDHIIPRSVAPALELDHDNLQILCGDCNIGKNNKFVTDHRPDKGLKLNENDN
tara:strand:- start:932 stop:1777 length:846 start_codon:yes stop_codon:yes gene_type:complete